MRIISKFKDYYDYMAYIYGTDNAVVYNRKRMDIPEGGKEWMSDTFQLKFDSKYRISRLSYREYGANPFKYLVVAGVGYILVGTEPFGYGYLKYEVLNTVKHSKVLEKVNQYGFDRSVKRNAEDIDAGDHSSLMEDTGDIFKIISLKLNQPVFVINGGYWEGADNSRTVVEIERNIPKLGELNVSSIITAQDMYVNIETFMANVLRKNPDTQPPVTVSNDMKIQKAGFDMKSSFRHPVK